MTGNAQTATDLLRKLRLPVIGGPMFIASSPALVIAQCTSGIVGAIPALNARSTAALVEMICEIEEALQAYDAANPEKKAHPIRSTWWRIKPMKGWTPISRCWLNIRFPWPL